MTGRRGITAIALGAVAVAAALALGVSSQSAGAKPPAAPAAAAANCTLANGVQHVIYLQFDNVHFRRDNPNVPSDLEQMPHLLNFIRDNGTLDTNDHTQVISHTGGGILSSLTGLYPNRTGQGVSNSYGYFRPDGSVGFSSSFKYWTDNTDGGNPANNPPTPSADPNYNMVNDDPPSLGGTGAVRNTPAPWVPYTRAGCDVGGVGLANLEQENNNSIITRSSGNTTLAAASTAGATSITVASAANLAPGLTIILENGTARAEVATIASITGTTVNLTAATANAHLSGGAVTVYAADPTGDMTKVFGAGSPQWIEGRNSQIAPSNTAARALAQTDFVGIAIHCAAGGGICNSNQSGAQPDQLPDEAGGYSGFEGLFGAKYVDPAINGGSASVGDVVNAQPITDPFGQPGFPGFDGMLAKNTLGYVAQMQESGIPITFGYISDAHDFHGVSGNDHRAYGPGEAGYVQQLKDYDQAFADFFDRLQSDGINKSNTLFVVTVEEGDHFAGTPPDGPCDGVTTPCTYANGHVTEVNGDLKRMVATYNAANGTSATTDFSVHSDMAPNVYITGNPARTSATARTLEQTMSNMSVTNPLSGVHEPVFVAMADPVEENILHMTTTADPARTPTFTPFAQGDYFLNASSTAPCTNNDLSNCVFLPNTNPPNQTFAWNHGGIQPEVNSTWAGWVGPGVAKNAQLSGDFYSDHTDLRPSMLALLGLKDSYVSDGRVLTELLKNSALPQAVKTGTRMEELGQIDKQINAPYGQFAQDTLRASTAALASSSTGDATYVGVENQLKALGDQRDALAGQIRLALWNAEFNDQPISQQDAKAWIDQGNALLAEAAALPGT